LKLLLTKQQDKVLKRLFNEGIRQGKDEVSAKETILEQHILKGLEVTPAESLSGLSSSDMATALFNDYGIKKEVLALQKHEVEFTLNNYHKLKTTVVRKNAEELSEDEVIQIALGFANQMVKTPLKKKQVEAVILVEKVEMREGDNKEKEVDNNESDKV